MKETPKLDYSIGRLYGCRGTNNVGGAVSRRRKIGRKGRREGGRESEREEGGRENLLQI